MAKKADLKLYTPDRWYYVQRANDGRELSQIGFPTKELADSFKRAVDETVQQSVKSGAKVRAGCKDEVLEAKGWSVGGKVFSDFHEALWYMWTNCPNETIKGVF